MGFMTSFFWECSTRITICPTRWHYCVFDGEFDCYGEFRTDLPSAIVLITHKKWKPNKSGLRYTLDDHPSLSFRKLFVFVFFNATIHILSSSEKIQPVIADNASSLGPIDVAAPRLTTRRLRHFTKLIVARHQLHLISQSGEPGKWLDDVHHCRNISYRRIVVDHRSSFSVMILCFWIYFWSSTHTDPNSKSNFWNVKKSYRNPSQKKCTFANSPKSVIFLANSSWQKLTYVWSLLFLSTDEFRSETRGQISPDLTFLAKSTPPPRILFIFGTL